MLVSGRVTTIHPQSYTTFEAGKFPPLVSVVFQAMDLLLDMIRIDPLRRPAVRDARFREDV